MSIYNDQTQPLNDKPLDSTSLLKVLLTQFVEVNFVDLAKVGDETKLSDTHYRILVVQQVLDVAKTNNWGLCRNQDFIYAYNGNYWSLVEKTEMQSFLGLAAEKMGLRWDKARAYNFRKELYEQFLETANFFEVKNHSSILISLRNGTFEINNGSRTLRQFDQNDFITYQLPFSYEPNKKAPMFQKFLDEVLPDQDRQLVLSEFLGYLFTTGLKLEKALILFGGGANGKSVVFEIISALLGRENICNYSLNSLTQSNGYSRAMLANKLVNYASEINGNLEASLFKQLVSGEPVEARLPYGRPLIIKNYAKLVFNSNVLPQTVENTNAFFRRFIIIPFDQTIKEENQDIDLSKKIIQSELPGVFNWVLFGLDRILEKKRFTDCEAIKLQMEEFRKQSDPVALFIEDEGYKKSLERYIALKELYAKFKSYCYDSGFSAFSIKVLAERLRAIGYETIKKTNGVVVFATKEGC